MKRKNKAVVFDLYGTLIHIRNDSKAFVRLFKELGSENIHGAKRAKTIAFRENPANLRELARLINPNHSVDIKAFEDEISEEIKRAELYPKSIQVLERLRREGYSTGLISNLLIPYHLPFFELGLDKLMDHWVFSFEAGLKKPDPQIYRLMLDKLKMDPGRVWMIGDNPYCDVQGPISAGMKGILLDRTSSSPTGNVVTSLEGIFQFLE